MISAFRFIYVRTMHSMRQCLSKILIASLLGAFAGCATGELAPEENSGPSGENNTNSSSGNNQSTGSNANPGNNSSVPGERTVENGYVLDNCDLFSQNCADQGGKRHKCIIGIDGATSCFESGTERAYEEPCDWIDECKSGLACINWGDARGSRCERICVPDMEPSTCSVGEVCQGGISSTDTYRLCLPIPTSCNIITQDCQDGLSCVLRNHPVTGNPATLCGQAGFQDEGQPCGGDSGDCQVGLMCVRVNPEEAPQCVRACNAQTSESCRGETTCTGDTAAGVSYCR